VSDVHDRLTALSDAIERLHVGQASLFRNRLSRAIVFSNEAGDQILDGLLSGAAPDRIAAEAAEDPQDIAVLLPAIEQTLDAWRSAGLLSTTDLATHFPEEPPAGATSFEAVFHHAGRFCRLMSDSAALFGQIATLLCDFRLFGAHPSLNATVRMAEVPAGIAVFEDGRPLWRAATPDEARFLAMQALIAALTGGDATSAILHAGLVVKAQAGLLLAGTTGRGKTTLTLALADAGWAFGGDDMIALRSDGTATALPLGAHLKQNKDVQARSDARVVAWCDADGGLFWPPLTVTSGSHINIRAILLPHHAPDHAPTLNAVSPEAALEALVTTGSEPIGTTQSLSGIATLVNTAPAYTMTYASTAQALDLIDALPSAT